MSKIDKHKYDYLRDDDDYRDDLVEFSMNQYLKGTGRIEPNPPFTEFIHNDAEFITALKIACQHLIPCEVKSAQSSLLKAKKQGGKVSVDIVQPLIEEYAQDITYDPEMLEEIMESVYNWMMKNYPGPAWHPIVQTPRELWNTYPADHKSSQSSTGKGDRRELPYRKKMLKRAWTRPKSRSIIPARYRNKNCKIRIVYNNPLDNHWREARIFARVFAHWEKLPMDNHYSDSVVGKVIAQCQGECAYGGDYKSMDMHYSLPVAKRVLEIMYKIYMRLPYDEPLPKDIKEFADEVLEAIFHSPLLVGDEVWIALWTILSGIFPTHHIESFANDGALIETCRQLGFIVVPTPRKLKANEAFVLVCGDDSVIIFGSKVDKDKIAEVHRRVSEGLGQIVEVSKVDYSTDAISFCKKLCALRQGIKGFKLVTDEADGSTYPLFKYDIVRALNSVYHPENMPTLVSGVDVLVWATSILNCSRGWSSFTSVLEYLYTINEQFIDEVVLTKLDKGIFTSDLYNDWMLQDWWGREVALNPETNFALQYYIDKVHKKYNINVK